LALSYVGKGTAALSSGGTTGSVVPPLPSGLSVGDLMVLIATQRGNGYFYTPSGWTVRFHDQLYPTDNLHKLAIFYRFYQAGDGDPTLSWTGAGPNQTVIAQIFAFRGTSTTNPIPDLGPNSGNASQQNIGPITGFTPTINDGAVIVIGHKADNWTGVGTLSGEGLTWVEIDEPSTTLGGDAGQVYDYALYSGSPPTITDKTFTVTGGASATGAGKMFSISPPVTTIRTIDQNANIKLAVSTKQLSQDAYVLGPLVSTVHYTGTTIHYMPGSFRTTIKGPDGYFYCFWADNNINPYLWYKSSADGLNWGAKTQASQEMLALIDCIDYEVFLDGNKIWICYPTGSYGTCAVKTRTGTMSGGVITWNNSVNLHNCYGWIRPSFAKLGSYVHLMLLNRHYLSEISQPYYIIGFRSTDGSSWETILAEYSTGKEDKPYVAICRSGSDALIMVVGYKDQSVWHYRKYVGGTWDSSDTQIPNSTKTANATVHNRTASMVYANGELHLVYIPVRTGGNLYYQYWNGSDWSSLTTVDNAGTVISPTLSLSPDGTKAYCWYKKSGLTHLYYRTLTLSNREWSNQEIWLSNEFGTGNYGDISSQQYPTGDIPIQWIKPDEFIENYVRFSWVAAPPGTQRNISQNATLKATLEKTISQNSTIKATTSQTIDQNARLKATQTQQISQNATVKATSQATIDQNAAIQAVTQTLTQNAHLKATSEKYLSQNAGIKATTERTVDQDAWLKAVQTKQISQDGHLKATSQQTVDQNARIKTATERTLSQDAWITAIEATQQFLDQNARLKTTTERTIAQDARIKETQTRTIDQNASIKTTTTQAIEQNATIQAVSQTISQNAFIKLTVERTISQDAHLKATAERTVDQNARIKETQIRTIEQNGFIKLVVERTISQDATVKATQIQNLSQDASISTAVSRFLEQDAYIRAIEHTLSQNARIKLDGAPVSPPSFGSLHFSTCDTIEFTNDPLFIEKILAGYDVAFRRLIGAMGVRIRLTGLVDDDDTWEIEHQVHEEDDFTDPWNKKVKCLFLQPTFTEATKHEGYLRYSVELAAFEAETTEQGEGDPDSPIKFGGFGFPNVTPIECSNVSTFIEEKIPGAEIAKRKQFGSSGRRVRIEGWMEADYRAAMRYLSDDVARQFTDGTVSFNAKMLKPNFRMEARTEGIIFYWVDLVEVQS